MTATNSSIEMLEDKTEKMHKAIENRNEKIRQLKMGLGYPNTQLIGRKKIIRGTIQSFQNIRESVARLKGTIESLAQ